MKKHTVLLVTLCILTSYAIRPSNSPQSSASSPTTSPKTLTEAQSAATIKQQLRDLMHNDNGPINNVIIFNFIEHNLWLLHADRTEDTPTFAELCFATNRPNLLIHCLNRYPKGTALKNPDNNNQPRVIEKVFHRIHRNAGGFDHLLQALYTYRRDLFTQEDINYAQQQGLLPFSYNPYLQHPGQPNIHEE